MVLVFGLTATALGAAPTRIVAMTLITPGAGGAAVGAGDVAAAVAVAVPVTVSKAVAADKTACRVSLMQPSSLTSGERRRETSSRTMRPTARPTAHAHASGSSAQPVAIVW